jgi:uncharacterized protein YggU (UPF0235/DUF167 family)
MIYKARVSPRSKQNKVIMTQGGAQERECPFLRVYTAAAPEDGKANEAVVKLLAAHFGVPKSCVKILRGQTCRDKIVEIS